MASRGIRTLLAAYAAVPVCEGFRVSRAADAYAAYDGKPLVKLTPCTKTVVDQMSAFITNQTCQLLSEEDLDLKPDGSCAETLAVCSKAGASSLILRFGNAAVIVQQDTGKFYREESGNARGYAVTNDIGELTSEFYSQWRDFDAREARVAAIIAASNGTAKRVSIGKSLEGRDIYTVRLTGKGWVKGAPRLVITGNMHAREWMGGMATMYLLEQLAARTAKDPAYLAGMQVDVVPMSNPDGFIFSTKLFRFHRKNMRKNLICTGVDINRNFNVSWAKGGSSPIPCMDNYHGPGPLSEPETVAVTKLMEESPMTVFIDIHAYSELILTAWAHTRADHPRKAEYVALGSQMKSAIDAKHGHKYTLGATAQILYAASGGSLDYAAVLGALGFCYELRPTRLTGFGLFGFAPPASQIRPGAEECYEGIKVTIEHLRSKLR